MAPEHPRMFQPLRGRPNRFCSFDNQQQKAFNCENYLSELVEHKIYEIHYYVAMNQSICQFLALSIQYFRSHQGHHFSNLDLYIEMFKHDQLISPKQRPQNDHATIKMIDKLDRIKLLTLEQQNRAPSGVDFCARAGRHGKHTRQNETGRHGKVGWPGRPCSKQIELPPAHPLT